MDYVSKWKEANILPTNDAKVLVVFIKKYIFNRYGSPNAIISDGGTHLSDRLFKVVFHKYEVQHRIVILITFIQVDRLKLLIDS